MNGINYPACLTPVGLSQTMRVFHTRGSAVRMIAPICRSGLVVLVLLLAACGKDKKGDSTDGGSIPLPAPLALFYADETGPDFAQVLVPDGSRIDIRGTRTPTGNLETITAARIEPPGGEAPVQIAFGPDGRMTGYASRSVSFDVIYSADGSLDVVAAQPSTSEAAGGSLALRSLRSDDGRTRASWEWEPPAHSVPVGYGYFTTSCDGAALGDPDLSVSVSFVPRFSDVTPAPRVRLSPGVVGGSAEAVRWRYGIPPNPFVKTASYRAQDFANDVKDDMRSLCNANKNMNDAGWVQFTITQLIKRYSESAGEVFNGTANAYRVFCGAVDMMSASSSVFDDLDALLDKVNAEGTAHIAASYGGVPKTRSVQVVPAASTTPEVDFQWDAAQCVSVAFDGTAFTVNRSSGVARVPVKRTGVRTKTPVRVTYVAAGGTAVPGTDYSPATGGGLNVGAEDGSTGYIEVPVYRNESQTAPVTVELSIVSATGARVGTPSAALLTIMPEGAVASIGSARHYVNYRRRGTMCAASEPSPLDQSGEITTVYWGTLTLRSSLSLMKAAEGWIPASVTESGPSSNGTGKSTYVSSLSATGTVTTTESGYIFFQYGVHGNGIDGGGTVELTPPITSVETLDLNTGAYTWHRTIDTTYPANPCGDGYFANHIIETQDRHAVLPIAMRPSR